LREFLEGLNQSGVTTARRTIPDSLRPVEARRTTLNQPANATPSGETDEGDSQLRTSRMMQHLNQMIDADTIVIADIGDSLFAATELTIHDRGEFLSPAYYTSMGFSIPAALGAATARPDHRIVVLVGDGAFQMTGQELGTLVARGHHPIVIILDNHGYGTERYLHAGDWHYNEIYPWNYVELVKVYGKGIGHCVETESEYVGALQQAWQDPTQLHLIQAKLMEHDASDTLKKLAARMSDKVGGG
jgi:indolepyruvate decarboxylase